MKNFDPAKDFAFNRALSRRPVLPPSANLTARIIAAALQRVPALQNFSLAQWVQELFADFMLPKPAYAFSGVLVAGILMGFVLAPALLAEEAGASSTHIIMTDDGDLP